MGRTTAEAATARQRAERTKAAAAARRAAARRGAGQTDQPAGRHAALHLSRRQADQLAGAVVGDQEAPARIEHAQAVRHVGKRCGEQPVLAIELLLLAVNINLVAFSAYLGDMKGQIFAMFVLTVAAAEAAVGLAILVTFFRNRGDIAVDDASMMKG